MISERGWSVAAPFGSARNVRPRGARARGLAWLRRLRPGVSGWERGDPRANNSHPIYRAEPEAWRSHAPPENAKFRRKSEGKPAERAAARLRQASLGRVHSGRCDVAAHMGGEALEILLEALGEL